MLFINQAKHELYGSTHARTPMVPRNLHWILETRSEIETAKIQNPKDGSNGLLGELQLGRLHVSKQELAYEVKGWIFQAEGVCWGKVKRCDIGNGELQ